MPEIYCGHCNHLIEGKHDLKIATYGFVPGVGNVRVYLCRACYERAFGEEYYDEDGKLLNYPVANEMQAALSHAKGNNTIETPNYGMTI